MEHKIILKFLYAAWEYTPKARSPTDWRYSFLLLSHLGTFLWKHLRWRDLRKSKGTSSLKYNTLTNVVENTHTIFFNNIDNLHSKLVSKYIFWNPWRSFHHQLCHFLQVEIVSRWKGIRKISQEICPPSLSVISYKNWLFLKNILFTKCHGRSGFPFTCLFRINKA